jgi:hypothetical protein
MLRSVKELRNYTIRAYEGDLGGVCDFYFDVQTWTLRYLAVETVEWQARRQVLISTIAVSSASRTERSFAVNLTKEQIEGSPLIDQGGSVSRSDEMRLVNYFGWPVYWRVGDKPAPADSGTPSEWWEEERIASSLHSLGAMTGCNIRTTDGEIGHVADFLVDDDSWVIRYFVLDARTWLANRYVVLSPAWIDQFDWLTGRMKTDLSREAVKNSPPYEPGCPITPAYSIRLKRHYRSLIPHSRATKRSAGKTLFHSPSRR